MILSYIKSTGQIIGTSEGFDDSSMKVIPGGFDESEIGTLVIGKDNMYRSIAEDIEHPERSVTAKDYRVLEIDGSFYLKKGEEEGVLIKGA